MKTMHSTKHAGKITGFVLGLALLPWAAFGQSNYATPYTFTTFVGNNGYGSADGTNSNARFAGNNGATVDSAGNVYVTDFYNATIRKVARVGTNWVVTTIAGLAGHSGSANGTGSAARFNNPTDVRLDSTGNIYVADTSNDTIRKLTLVGTNWVVTTIAGLAGNPGSADGTVSAARFKYPGAAAAGTNGNLYVTDNGNNTIRMITPAGGVTTIAGLAGSSGNADGIGSAALFNAPLGLDVDKAGNLYVADNGNNTIREVMLVGTDWVVTTLAGLAGTSGSGDGTNSDAQFNSPADVTVDNVGNLYVADSFNNTVRQVKPVGTDWVVSTLAGLAYGGTGSADGTGGAAQFDYPYSAKLDSAGNVYVADLFNHTIRQVTPAGVVTTLAGMAGISGADDGTGSAARFNRPGDVAADSAGNLYVADRYNHTIRQMTPIGTNWVVTTIAGVPGVSGFVNGLGTAAKFDYPSGVAVDSSNNVYVADWLNHAIRKVTPVGTTWVVTTVSQSFSAPTGVAVGPDGNLYVADINSDIIRKVTPAGLVTILAGSSGVPGSADGTGSAARFNTPGSVAVDSATNVYVSDYGNNTIRKVTPVGATWVVTTLAGLTGNQGYADGTGNAAQFFQPSGISVDSAGVLYVADSANNTIRKGYPASSVPAPLLQPPSLSTGQFGFGITGLSGLAVNIESSTDLSQWQLASTLTLVGGTNYFVSPKPASDIQFYRGHLR